MKTAEDLIKAINWNDFSWLKQMLYEGNIVNATNRFGETALMHACTKGNPEIITYLIEQGANLNMQSEQGLTALMLAAENGNANAAKILVSAGADKNLISLGLRTAYDYARLKGYSEIESLLYPVNEELKFEKIERAVLTDIVQQTEANKLLNNALWSNDLEMAKAALKAGASPNEAFNNFYPIHLSVIQKNINLVKLLLAQEVDVDVKDSTGITAVVKACGAALPEILRVLLENGAHLSSDAIMAAQVHKHPKVIEIIEKEKFKAGTPGIGHLPDEEQEFYNAVCKGNDIVVKNYLKKGIKPDLQDLGGSTPLYWAARKGHSKVAQLLIAHKADVNYTTPEKWTALMEASLVGNDDVAQLLIEKGANVNMVTVENATALLMAVSRGNTPIVKLLLRAGAAKSIIVQKGYYEGKTPLLIAKERNFNDIVDLLS